MSTLGFCSVSGCTLKVQIYDDSRYMGCRAWCGWQPCCNHAKPDDQPCPICDIRARLTRRTIRALDKIQGKAMKTLLDTIHRNKDSIEAAALQLRPGPHKAHLKPLNKNFSVPPYSGSMCNINAELDFDDGVRWLVRVKSRQTWAFMPFPHQVAASEVASIRVLHSVASDLVPNAWMPPFPIADLPLNFVERFPGTPHDTEEENDESYMPNLIHDYALALDKFSRVSFEGIGCLVDDPVRVGPEQLLDSRLAAAGPRSLGPFKTMLDYFTVRVDTLMNLLLEGAYNPTSKLFSYLVLLEIKVLVNDYPEFALELPTYVTHLDDSGSHLLMSEGRLSGIIDWECAMTFPLPMAMQATWMNSTLDSNAWETFTQEEGLLQEELVSLGRHDLADAYVRGRHYLLPFLLLDDGLELENLGLLNRMRKCFLGDDSGPIPESKEEWIQAALLRYADDTGLKVFLSREAAPPSSEA